MPPSFLVIFILSVLLGPLWLAEGKPTVYMKNENDKLEPVLLPVSSTVIPIPVGYYQQLRAGVGVHNGKLTKQKIKLTKPNGPGKLITDFFGDCVPSPRGLVKIPEKYPRHKTGKVLIFKARPFFIKEE